MGNPKENIYQSYNGGEQESKLAELNECWRRYETDVKKQLDARIPNRVRMEMGRQVGRMRNNMQWYSDLPPRDLAKTKLAREFFEDVNGVLSFADRSRWEEAYHTSKGSNKDDDRPPATRARLTLLTLFVLDQLCQ